MRTAMVRWAVVAAFTAAGSGVAYPVSAEDAAVCTWGGTAADATGTFTVEPGLRTVPATTPIEFTVTGDLAGPSPRCAGTMTIHGFDIPGSRCAFGFGAAEVLDVPGLASSLSVGALHYNRQVLFNADGRIVGGADIEVASSGLAELRAGCESEAGVTTGKFSSVVTLYPAAV